MYRFAINVSIRKEKGFEWYQKTYTVTYDDVNPDLSIDDLKEWAKEDIRNQLRTSADYNKHGENWVIESVVQI